MSAGSVTSDRGPYPIASSWGDFDNDGSLDLFVANYQGGPNFLYHNDGAGSFTKIITGRIVTDGSGSTGCAWGDYDNDGLLDLFVANNNLNSPGEKHNFLYHNDGNGAFTRVTGPGVGSIVTDLAEGWDCAWADYDNDGYLDLFVSNAAGLHNALYQNNGDGTFTKITRGSLVNDRAGIGFSQGSRNCSWGDYDNDGFLDLFVGNKDARNNLYRNNGNSHAWIKFKLVGTASNSSAIGAKVRVKAVLNRNLNPDPAWQLREISGGGSSGSQSGLLPHFGLGDAAIAETVRIEWPSGIVQELHNVAPKQFLTVTESGVAVVPRVANLVTYSNHVFTARATFDGSLTYQWQFNGVDIAGATGATYTVANASAAQAGEYSVTVRDAAGAVLAASSPSQLRLDGPPVIKTQPQAQIVAAGSDLILSVGVVPSTSALSYRWLRDGVELNVPNLPSLIATNVQVARGGIVSVVVTNSFGSVTSSIAPVTVIQDTSVSGSLDARVVLSLASGGPPLTSIQWRFNGVDIPGATEASYVIRKAQQSNVGQYSTVVTTAFGSFTNFSTPLIVDPTFTKITTGPIVNAFIPDEGSAIAWVDFDGDGWLDLTVGWGGAPGPGLNSLYRNNGNGTFTKMTTGVIATDVVNFASWSWGDFNNDGNIDVVSATLSEGTYLYRSDGGGAFSRVNSLIPGGDKPYTTLGIWGDYDNDGWLDLLVGDQGIFPRPKTASLIYHNNGNETFTKITQGELAAAIADACSALWFDLDNDGSLDLFFGTCDGKNFILRNDGNGSFTKVQFPYKGYPNSAADYDNDGFLDLFLGNSDGIIPAVLLHNNGDGAFSQAITTGTSGGAGVWGDYDNDGYLDLLFGGPNGRFILSHNNGDGTFTRITTGSLVSEFGGRPSAAWGDYDNDGFLDLYASGNRTSQPLLFRNNGNTNAWIKFKLEGTASNRSAIGAKVRVKTTGARTAMSAGLSDAAATGGDRGIALLWIPAWIVAHLHEIPNARWGHRAYRVTRI